MEQDGMTRACARKYNAQPLCLRLSTKSTEPGCADTDADSRGTAVPLPADYQALGAGAKRELLWSNMTRSAYADDALPATEPGLVATLPLIWPPGMGIKARAGALPLGLAAPPGRHSPQRQVHAKNHQ